MMTVASLTLPAWMDIEGEVYDNMGYGTTVPEEAVVQISRDIYEKACCIARPQVMYELLDAVLPSRKQIEMGGQCFDVGGIIGSYLPGVTQACVFVATAGVEYEQYLHSVKSEGDILAEFVADAIGSALVERCVEMLSQHLTDTVPMSHSLPYSPGYCGWHITQQQPLFSLFPPSPCGVTLSASCLMSPVKSVSGFFALGNELKPQPYRCELCSNPNCYKKRR